MSDPHQLAAADPTLSVFVTANAGSGKTTTLVSRVARLLLAGVKPGEILCVTYTKAAAAEMQTRLYDRLGSWAVMEDDELLKALTALQGGIVPPEAFANARRLFARALETPGGLKIQTIHAFCETLLKRFPVEAGVDPNFDVLENEDAAALSRIARETLAIEAGRDPDSPLGEAFAHFAVALAWSSFGDLLGMLETERARLTAYIDGVAAGALPDPWVLAEAERDVTAAEIERRFLDSLDLAAVAEAADAFSHGSANEQKLAGCIAEALEAPSLLAFCKVFRDSKGQPRQSFGVKASPPAAVATLTNAQPAFEAAINAYRAARVAEDTVRVLTLARYHAAFYEAEKARRGALDFGDLVRLSRDLLVHKADAAWVLYKLDGGFEHVLVDEAQDTAPEQWAVIRALTAEFFAGEGAERLRTLPRTVFAVGDEKQSIYSFQGARPERLRREAQAYDTMVTGSGGRFEGVPLATSYRSTPEVLRFVDEAFSPRERMTALVGEDLAEMPPHQPSRRKHAGSVELWPLFTDTDAPERDAWTAPVDQESETSGRKLLARSLAAEIKRQVTDGVSVYDRATNHPRPAAWGDFLILVRRRDATFEEIIRALKAEGVPVAGADRLKLSDHILFDDMMALARVALYPDDDLSLAEVLRSPFCDVPDFGPADSLFVLADKQTRGGKPLWRTLRERADEHPSWVRARRLISAAIAARGDDPFAFFSGLLNHVDDLGLSGRARVLHRLGREAEEAIDETLNQVLAAEKRGGTDLETCLHLLEIADVEVKRELDAPRAEVRVMTVHGAKGLEAPVVILPDTTMRAKPQGPTLLPVEWGDPAVDDAREGWLMAPGRSGEDCAASALARQARVDRTNAESLRLLYVALTRARDRLIVMGKACRSPKQGFEDGSWYHVVRDTFAALPSDQIHQDDRGVLRYGPEPGRMVGAAANDDRAAVDAPPWARTPPPPERARKAASPSTFARSHGPAAVSPLAETGGGLGRFRRGDLIHRLLERLPDIAPNERPAAAQRALARERDLTDAQREEMISAALGVMDDARFAEVFGPGSRAEVAVVGGAPELPDGDTVSGRVDRLVITPQRVLVVDYKTNRPSPDRVEDADPSYLAQMAIYVAVLRQVFPGRQVQAALVWTDGPKLMPIPDALASSTLATLGRVAEGPADSYIADPDQE